jgi:hypothetical protein
MYKDDNVLFIDFQKADMFFDFETTTDKIYYFVSKAAKTKKYSRVLLTDTWESFSYDLTIEIARRLIDDGHFGAEQISVMFFLYPFSEKYINEFKDLGITALYHVNYFFPRIYFFNQDVYNTPSSERNFLALNNVDTVARRYMISQLHESGINSGISWGGSNEIRAPNDSFFRNKNSLRLTRDFSECCDEDTLNLINKHSDWFSEPHRLDEFDDHSDDRYTINNPFLKYPINLVTETRTQPIYTDNLPFPRDVYSRDYLHVSEKTVKVLMTEQIFFLYSSMGILKYLQDFGFKTFGDYIDESYDSEPNWTVRAQKIATNIKTLMNMPEDRWQKLFAATRPIVKHNREFIEDFTLTARYIVKL